VNLEEVVTAVVANSVTRLGNACNEDETRDALGEVGRRARQHAASSFAQGARDFANGMDMFDNTDRSHRAHFADWWDGRIAEQVRPSLARAGQAENPPVVAILDTALEFARREWAREAAEAAKEARTCADVPSHGSHLLHRLADRWNERAKSWSAATDLPDQSLG